MKFNIVIFTLLPIPLSINTMLDDLCGKGYMTNQISSFVGEGSLCQRAPQQKI